MGNELERRSPPDNAVEVERSERLPRTALRRGGRRMAWLSKWLTFDRRLLLLTLASGFPAVCLVVMLLIAGGYSARTIWTASLFVILSWWAMAAVVRQRIVHPLHTVSNLLAGLREGDFSTRARGACGHDPLGEVLMEVNGLSDWLQRHRFEEIEAAALLRSVIAEIDVAVFTFDEEHRLQLVNRAGQRLLAQPIERLLGRRASDLGLADPLHSQNPDTTDITFPGGTGRWRVSRAVFREEGRPHHLLVLSDLSRELREEERKAWQRLVRVLGHELNNSLAPIKSIAGSLENLLRREDQQADWKEDMVQGLKVIGSRAEALNRFMKVYAQLSRLPPPVLRPVEVSSLVQRIGGLKFARPVEIKTGPALTIRADSDQLEQLLINLIQNAIDAAEETGGGVCVTWRRCPGVVELVVLDEGPGLTNTANLFVPFFTTKSHGSGIGLVLSRQIAEAHGGSLVLVNRDGDTRGCEARLRLPAAHGATS